MKYLMAFMFAAVPAAAVFALTYWAMGPFSWLLAWGGFGLGFEVCTNGSGDK